MLQAVLSEIDGAIEEKNAEIEDFITHSGVEELIEARETIAPLAAQEGDPFSEELDTGAEVTHWDVCGKVGEGGTCVSPAGHKGRHKFRPEDTLSDDEIASTA